MMISRTWSRKSPSPFFARFAVLAFTQWWHWHAGAEAASGELSVSGHVTVNGQAAISGATVFSDSVIATGANSSATISLGKLGRVELFPKHQHQTKFGAANISASLEAGRVQVATLAGTAAIVTAKGPAPRGRCPTSGYVYGRTLNAAT